MVYYTQVTVYYFALNIIFIISSRILHTRYIGDWSSDVCSSDLATPNSRALYIACFEALSGTYKMSLGWSCTSSAVRSSRSEERRVGKSVEQGGCGRVKY